MIYTIIKKRDDGSVESVISFDSVRDFSESWTATATSQTTEYGFNLTDNINIESPEFSLSGIISSYSLYNTGSEIVWDGVNFKTADERSPLYHLNFRKQILDVFQKRSVVSLVESELNSFSTNPDEKYSELKQGYDREIPNCVILSLDISYLDNSSSAFSIAMKLRRIDVATVTTMQLTEDEMTPELRMLTVNSTTTSTSTSTSTDPSTEGVAGKPADPSKTKEAVKKESGGLDWNEEYQSKQQQMQPDRDQFEALKKAREATALDGKPRYVEKAGSGWNTTTGGL